MAQPATQANPPPTPTRRAVIQLQHVTKMFGDVVGVDDLNFEVYAGEIFGFIGPSGSGKTTAMRLINGIYTPTSGEVRLLGTNPAQSTRALHEEFGYMPQQFVLYPNLTVYENLNFMAGVHGIGWRERGPRINRLLDFVELQGARGQLAENISGGMQRRLELAASLIHDPGILFADEPTAGIDPVLRGKFWEEFRRLRDTGRTLFVTTQYVGESEYCDRVGVIRKGKIVAVNTPLELRRMAMNGDIVELESPGLTEDVLNRVLAAEPYMVKQDGRLMIERVNTRDSTALRLHVTNAGDALPLLLNTLEGAGVSVSSAQEFRPTFDDVFIQLMGRTTSAE